MFVIDAKYESWVPVSPQSDFPIQNLPYGTFACGKETHIGVAIGEKILDLYAVAEAGLFNGVCSQELFTASTLNRFLDAGRNTWTAVRKHIFELLVAHKNTTTEHENAARTRENAALRERNMDAFFVNRNDVRMRVPVEIGDYIDFYSSIEHATNVGKLFRPNGDPLLPNWKWLPIGYHGRANTIVIDGTPIVRPHGQRKPPDVTNPTFGPSRMLDIELEMAFITGSANTFGNPIPISAARDHIFGMVLLNDWSARDIQAWESQPLGPFLGKSFATTISPWVVPLDALEPFRTAAPVQDPAPLAYLADARSTYDIALEVLLATQTMREKHETPVTISRSNFKYLYWTIAQQLTHATSNGAIARSGDLFASGTISGSSPDSLGSLLELTWRGARPLSLPDCEHRSFLEDGDEITLRGSCTAEGQRSIGFGCARGTIIPTAQGERPTHPAKAATCAL